MAKRIESSSLRRFDAIQETRYSVAGGKDGDGDPAYARDVLALQRNSRNDLTTLVAQKDGSLVYKRSNGD